MSDLTNNVIDQVTELVENSDLETTVLEPAKKWIFDKKSAIIGAAAGVGGTLGVTKFIDSRKKKKMIAAMKEEGLEVPEQEKLSDRLKKKFAKKVNDEIEEFENDDDVSEDDVIEE